MTGATPHAVTQTDMVMLEKDLPGRVDRLDEALQGLQGFGTLLVVPKGKTLETDFQWSLPSAVIEVDPASNARTYRLTVQKQAGTEATPITLRVHLPHGSKVTSVSPQGFVQAGDNIQFTMKLTTDINIEIQFQP